MTFKRILMASAVIAALAPNVSRGQGFQAPGGGGRKDFAPADPTPTQPPAQAPAFPPSSGQFPPPPAQAAPFPGQFPNAGAFPPPQGGGMPSFGAPSPNGQMGGGQMGGGQMGGQMGGQQPRLGFGAPPPPPAPPPGQPQRPNLADELTDFGVPPQSEMKRDVATPTPMSIPGGHVITTLEVAQTRGMQVLLLDVLAGAPHQEIPGAVWLPGAGMAGTYNDDVQRTLWQVASQASHMNPEYPIVVFCAGSRCWESYNAALRLINLGFKTVLWYRGGLASWEAAGLPMSPPPGGGQQGQGGGFGFQQQPQRQ
jgi:PQQ-dependent catabolism-associated CXXCW motif protein